MKIAIIGGGAAGFFSALASKENYPDAEVSIFEKSNKLLSKVKVSGGGRCNVTNASTSIKELTNAYPRGGKLLKKAFKVFSTQHTQSWFEERGVALVTQENNHVFPQSQNSQTIIDCFLSEANRINIQIQLKKAISEISPFNDGDLKITFAEEKYEIFNKVIVATGGTPKLQGLLWLQHLGHKIETPVPSLFTFNMPNENIISLMGIVVNDAFVSIEGSKIKTNGPLLITHWGMSGPAILKASAYGARILHEKNYEFNIHVNWINNRSFEQCYSELKKLIDLNPQKRIANIRPFDLPDRLWQFILNKIGISPDKKWLESSKKELNKLVNALTNDVFEVRGKTTFKEEFVTCGGVSLESIDSNTMQSKVCPNLYFAGEILDIDGITGGYNFQAAWTTAYIAAQLK